MAVQTKSEIKSKKTFKCDYCGKKCSSNLKFKVFVVEIDLSEEYSQQACPDCIATFFTETPERIQFASISKVKEVE